MKRSPFTALCRDLARLARPSQADLHVHTTSSDGAYTPSQVVALARQAGLAAVAITDHDIVTGVVCEPGLEVIPGVEITTEFDSRELHLLGYFVDPGHEELNAALERVRVGRRERFHDYIAALAERGHVIPQDRVRLVEEVSPSLGRRHVAGLLVACGFARSQHEVFHRMLGPLRGSIRAKVKLHIAEAIALVHDAGGATSLAHPPPDLDDDAFRRLKDMGLDAVEAVYAWRRSAPGNRLRAIAARFGFEITGGSDCHGPHPATRRIGSYSVPMECLERLRGRCGSVPAG